MPRIILANGAEYPCDWCGGAESGRLYVDVETSESVAALAAAFSDPAATATLTFDYTIARRDYEGFTRLMGVQAGGWKPGATLITLEKEAAPNA